MNCSKLITSKIKPIISLLLISIFLTGCFYPQRIRKNKKTTEQITTTQQTTTEQTTTQQTTTTVITAPVYKMGDTLKTNSYYITVKGNRRSNQSSNQGHEYIFVDIEIENISSSFKQLFPTYLFNIVDQEGHKMHTISTAKTKGELNINLAPGRKVRGEFVAEVPKGLTGLELLIEPNAFTEGQAVVSLD